MNPANKPRVFALPVLDRWLVHAPLHEVTALVSRGAWQKLLHGDQSGSGDDLRALYEALAAEPLHAPAVKEGPFDPRYLALVTTRGCNIACVYCDFGGPVAPRVHMDPGLACRVIDWMADRLVANGKEEFFVHFFGGEPFISDDLVEVAVHRVRAVCAARGLRPVFDASTNGVFSEARAEWIGEYFDSVVLSLDGPPEFQNRNRPARGGKPTYETVARTVDRLSRTPIELCLRVCITAESVEHMPEMVRWMADKWQPAVITFEPLTENDLTSAVALGSAEPIPFARRWMEAWREAEARGIRLVYSATETRAHLITA